MNLAVPKFDVPNTSGNPNWYIATSIDSGILGKLPEMSQIFSSLFEKIRKMNGKILWGN